MRCSYACGSADHVISRRSFLGAAAAGLGLASGFSGMIQPAVSAELARRERQVLLIWLARRSEPARNVGPQAGHRHRRAVPVDRDLRARRADLGAVAA